MFGPSRDLDGYKVGRKTSACSRREEMDGLAVEACFGPSRDLDGYEVGREDLGL
jgi:hypothetical protein